MKIAIRNKWISFGGSSVVRDLEEHDILRVKGKFFTFTRKKFVQDLEGNTLFIVRNKFWRLFHYRALVLDPDKKLLVKVTKKIFSFHDRYLLDSDLGDLEIKGNILGFDYHVTLNGEEIAHVSRKISLRDSFLLETYKDDAIDYRLLVAFVIAIDNITDRSRSDASSSYSSSN